MKQVRRSYTAFNDLKYSIKFDFRGKLVGPLIKTGTLQVVCDILVLGLKDNAYCAVTSDNERKVLTSQADLLSECLQTVSSFTDTFPNARWAVVDHGHMLPLLVKKLDEWHTPHVDGTRLDVEEIYIRKSLTALFMVSADEEKTHTDYLRATSNFFSTFKKYLSSKVEDNRLTAIAVLANVAHEAEAKDIATDKDTVRFLLDQLRQTFSSRSKASSSGWTTVGLGKVVKNLARNDANKQLLVKEGALPLLVDGLKPEFQKSEDNAEKQWCLESLWWLSFEPHNRGEMMKNETLLDLVVDIYQEGPSSRCFVSAEGILFQLRDHLRKSDKYVGIANKLQAESESQNNTSADQEGHVMISYQTQYRPVVKMLCDFLQQNGVKMWMDIYNMSEGVDSTLQTMAEAVEGARVVLVCVSESYKNSPYCRQEAEYAFQKRKAILPLKVQRGYTPDGWLGFIQGAKYVYDFVREDPEYTENKRSQLFDTIRKIYAGKEPAEDLNRTMTLPTQQQATPSPEPMQARPVDKVKTWTKKDVQAWLQQYNLKGDNLEALSSDDILYLYELKSTAPESFHQSLKSDLDLNTISTRASFNKALTELPDLPD